MVVPPLIRRERYSDLGSGNYVTFINPIPKKGLDIVLELARRLPRVPFLLVESWPLGKSEWRELQARCSSIPNVTLRHSSLSMNPIYRHTRILLAPSQWIEAWGRVVTEAQFCGIPAVTSDSGGLPEAVGDGGIVIPRDAPINDWITAIQGLYENPQRWADLSARALGQSEVYAAYRDARYLELRAILAANRI